MIMIMMMLDRRKVHSEARAARAAGIGATAFGACIGLQG